MQLLSFIGGFSVVYAAVWRGLNADYDQIPALPLSRRVAFQPGKNS